MIHEHYRAGRYAQLLDLSASTEYTELVNRIDLNRYFKLRYLVLRSSVILGNVHKATEELQKMESIIDDLDDTSRAYLTLARLELLLITGKWDECIEEGRIHEEFLNRTLGDYAQVVISYTSGYISVVRGGESILPQLEEILDLAQKSKFYDFIPSIQGLISRYYRQNGELDLAIKLANSAVESSKRLGNSYKYANSLLFLGNTYNVTGDHSTALKFLKQAVVIAERNSFDVILGSGLSGIGATYTTTGEHEKALPIFKRAYEVFKKVGIKNQMSIALNNLGNTYRYLARLDLALEYLEKSLQLEKELHSPEGISFELVNIIRIYVLKGDLESAKSRLDELSAILTNYDSVLQKGAFYVETAKIHFYENKLDLAFQRYLEGWNIYRKSKNRMNETEVLFELVRVLTHGDMSEIKGIDREEQVKRFILELEDINREFRNPTVRYRLLISRVNYLNSRGEFSKSADLLEGVTLTEVSDAYLATQIILLKISSRMRKLESPDTDNATILRIKGEITDHIEKVQEVSEAAGMFPLIIQNYLLASRIALVFNEQERGRAFLLTAREYAHTYGFKLFQTLINDEITRFVSYMDKINSNGGLKDNLVARYEYLSVGEYLQLVINEQLEFLSVSRYKHKVGYDGMTLCGAPQSEITISLEAKCTKCRTISMETMLQKMVRSFLANWTCPMCYAQLPLTRIQQLLDTHSDHTTAKYNEFLGVSSSFLHGTIRWACPSPTCDNKEENQLDLSEELTTLFC